MNYSIKNLINTAKKQRLLSLLFVLNIIISCFVMCFSYLKEDDEYITVNGLKYRIEVLPKELVKPGMYEYKEDEIDIVHQIFIPFGTLPDDTEFVLEGETSPFFFEFYEPVTKSQYNDLAACLEAYTAGRATLPPMEFTEVSEIYYYRTILLISAVIAVLAAVNMAILYKYILERRAKTIVIFRICGSSLLRMCGMYICECMLAVIPLFALTELFYHTVIMPKLCTVFEYMESAYSLNIYLYIFVIYIVISFIVLLIMMIGSLRKQSLIEQKAKTVSHRSAVMKVFEICQLGAVLALCIMISSVIVSRYRLYEPFKDMLGGKGFIAYNAGGGGTTPDDLAKELCLFLSGIRKLHKMIQRSGDQQLVEFLYALSRFVADGHTDGGILRTLYLYDLGAQMRRMFQLFVGRFVDGLRAVLPGPQAHVDELDGGGGVQIFHHVCCRDLIEIAVSKGGVRSDPDLHDLFHPVKAAELIKGKCQILQVGIGAFDAVQRAFHFLGEAVVFTLGHAHMTVAVIALIFGVHDLHQLFHLAF